MGRREGRGGEGGSYWKGGSRESQGGVGGRGERENAREGGGGVGFGISRATDKAECPSSLGREWPHKLPWVAVWATGGLTKGSEPRGDSEACACHPENQRPCEDRGHRSLCSREGAEALQLLLGRLPGLRGLSPVCLRGQSSNRQNPQRKAKEGNDAAGDQSAEVEES